ncbi:MAG: hypothetical protein QOG00_3521 [Pyrinomonadaceae bacterium]|nr:hypothetical protein [Pyrinomonadaceae bacterium]MDX6272434.1 hypothetical protein [Acidobacteriota bacterium]
MKQTELFKEQQTTDASHPDQVVLYALADFQLRGKALAERELPLDRLRGALRRAADALGVAELSDEDAAAAIQMLGGRVRRVPPYVAKHPFRVTVPAEVAERAKQFYRDTNAADRDATRDTKDASGS